MQSYTYPNIPDTNGVVATTGFFDGVHMGHRAVLQQLVKVARQQNKPSCVITFWPHPRIVLQKGVDSLKLLSTLEEKKELIASLGIDYFYVVPFTLELAGLSAQQFFYKCLVQQLKVEYLIVGYDHHFGKGGSADFSQIEQLGNEAGVTVEQVTANNVDGMVVSSTKIRDALQNGELDLANNLLGYPYILGGMVVHGKKNGRKIGFPTANIQPCEPLKLLPKDGIYAVEVIVDNVIYKGMLSIGLRPTIDDERIRTIEVNILDFNRDIYGEYISVRLIRFLRDEWKFDGLETLRQQIIKDKINTLAVFNRLMK